MLERCGMCMCWVCAQPQSGALAATLCPCRPTGLSPSNDMAMTSVTQSSHMSCAEIPEDGTADGMPRPTQSLRECMQCWVVCRPHNALRSASH